MVFAGVRGNSRQRGHRLNRCPRSIYRLTLSPETVLSSGHENKSLCQASVPVPQWDRICGRFDANLNRVLGRIPAGLRLKARTAH
jgi:hypothetical protein